MFERVIQEVCDASQVDFEESGVDQKTLLDLREVSAHFPGFIWWFWMAYGVGDSGGWPKAGEPEVLREAVLMGEHWLLRLSLYAPAAIRFGA